MIHSLLHVEDLSSEGEDSLIVGVTALLCRSACRVTLDEEHLAFGGVAALAGREFAGDAASGEGTLVLHAHTCRIGGVTRLGGKLHLVDDGLRLLRMFLKIVAERLAHRTLDGTGNLVVTEFGLGLPLELRFSHLDRDDGCQTVAEVLFR